MSGAQGKKAHTCLKGGQGSHRRRWIEDWIFCVHDYFSFSNCLVEIVVLLSIRNYCLGIPSPLLRGLLKELYWFSSHPGLRPSILLRLQRYLWSRIMLCCRVLQWGFTTPLPSLVFQRRMLSFLWEIILEVVGAYFRSWHLANTFSCTYSAVSLSDFVIFSWYLQWGIAVIVGGWDLQC